MAKTESPESIDLAKMPCWPRNENWIGKELKSIIDPDRIEKIILLQAVTSAPASIDIMSILRMLADKAVFEKKPENRHEEYWIWEAILITENEKYYHFYANHEWIYLISQTAHGFCRMKEK